MTKTNWHPFKFLLNRTSRQITNDGTYLQLEPYQEGGQYFNASFSLHKIGLISEFGDILALDIQIPDVDGQLWQATSRFSTVVLIKYLGDLVYEPTWPRFYDPGKTNMAESFGGGLLLERLHYFSDERYVRNIAVENKILGIYFKYTQIMFDVGIPPRDSKSIAVRASSIGQALHDESGKNHEIYYQIPITYLMQHNTMSDISEDHVGDNDIAEPLIFTKTDLKGEPQVGVREIV